MAGPWNCSHRLAWTWQAVVTGHRREAGATGEGRRGASGRTPHQAGGVRAARNTSGGQGHPLTQGARQRRPGPHCAPRPLGLSLRQGHGLAGAAPLLFATDSISTTPDGGGHFSSDAGSCANCGAVIAVGLRCVVSAFRRRLTKIPGVTVGADALQRRPTIDPGLRRRGAARVRFGDALSWFYVQATEGNDGQPEPADG